MNTDHLRKAFPHEAVCREFFESVIWTDAQRCPHCGHRISCRLHGAHLRAGVYPCYRCKRQFTVTTKTPLHSTKLPLWKWLQAMYYMVNSSKGISSLVLGRWLGVTQPTALTSSIKALGAARPGKPTGLLMMAISSGRAAR
jgi:transposase-like protein